MQNPSTCYIDAIIFDLDGVLTDTAEYHFRAWKRLADEENIPFTRGDNEHLRGVSRRESLQLLLKGHEISEEQAFAWMERKNSYYREMISNISPAEILPGVVPLLREIRAAGIKIAVASASRNAGDVLAGLQLRKAVDALVDGSRAERAKPAPDLFLEAARDLRVSPVRCLVVEDAAAGVEAAHAAGMVAVGLGPPERFGQADLILPSLEDVTLADLTYAATWRVSESHFDPAQQRVVESNMTQGNGYVGTRATLEERHPGDQQATLIHGLWDDAPIVFTELVNVADWTSLEITVDGHRFAMSQGIIRDYARYLDLRTGVLHRRLRWHPSDDRSAFDITFERFPSLADPHVLAIRVALECVRGEADVQIAVDVEGHVENQGLLHWNLVEQKAMPDEACLVVRTRHTEMTLAMCARVIATGAPLRISPRDCHGRPGLQVEAQVSVGQALIVDKLISVFTSRETEDVLEAARQRARDAARQGYASLRAANEAAWEAFWHDADVVVEGDDEAQLALRHALFHIRIAASATDEHVSVAAKTLSGFGYRGHVFWDTEVFVLPFFTYVQPELARNMVMYRWHTLEGARRNAAHYGLDGARYAWESAATGDEVTPTWVTDPKKPSRLIRIWCGDIELHITADVAYAIWQYWQVTGDDVFMRGYGAPIILESAVYWGQRVERENGKYALRDVIGPDEYHEHVDNNAFTNRMVAWHLEKALYLYGWLHEQAPDTAAALDAHLGLTPDRLAHWRHVAQNMIIHQDPSTGLIEQFEGFFGLKEVNWPDYADRTKSMQVLLGIEGANQHQVIKQADVIILLCLLKDEFDTRTWQANWDYYVPRTDHTYGSSLGPAIHAWAACEIGQIDVAYEHFLRAARTDLVNIRGNTAEGVHGASMGGLWQAVVFGFAGLEIDEHGFRLNPRLPAHWKRLSFCFYYRGERQIVDLPGGRPMKPAGSNSEQRTS